MQSPFASLRVSEVLTPGGLSPAHRTTPATLNPARRHVPAYARSPLRCNLHAHLRHLPWTRWRRICLSALLLLAVFVPLSTPASAYSVLTHEQLVDLSWKSLIVPILLARYPTLTPAQLAEAHAYAYGGCAIQDLGYYPFGNPFFSDLTHYVRSGDFVRSLFLNARNADELAFAIGALSHYVGDTIGHSQAINPSVADEFPRLRAKYGPSVNYAEDEHAHVQTEFAFDINQISKHRLAPSTYLRHIGIEVPERQLAAAFYETYGLPIQTILGEHHPTVRTYRFGVRSFLPRIAYAENLLHHNRFPADTPGPELDRYISQITQLSTEAGWDAVRKRPGVGTYLLAGFIVICPKIGPAALFSIKGPTVSTEDLYIESVNRSSTSLRTLLDELAVAGRRSPDTSPQPGDALDTLAGKLVPNRDLDTGRRVQPGGYRLTDQTYAKLLDRITRDPSRPVPAGLRQDVLDYYADPNAPIFTRRHPAQWARVQADLARLRQLTPAKDNLLPPPADVIPTPTESPAN